MFLPLDDACPSRAYMNFILFGQKLSKLITSYLLHVTVSTRSSSAESSLSVSAESLVSPFSGISADSVVTLVDTVSCSTFFLDSELVSLTKVEITSRVLMGVS